jgi:AcrR family transcriptional regulator
VAVTATDTDVGTRQRLLDAAAEVFAEKGYERAGVQEIARRAGLTTGAIYSRFSGKAQLLAEAIDARSHSELDDLFAQHRFQGSAADILATVGSHLVSRPPDTDSTGRALLLEAFVAARRDPDVAAALNAHVEERASRLAALVEAGKADGQVDPALDTDAVVRFCHAVGLGFLLTEAIDLPVPAVAPWEDLITRLVGALGTGTTSPPTTPSPTTTPTTRD